MDLKPTLIGLDLNQATQFVESLDLPKYRGKQLLEWIYEKRISSLDQAQNLPKEFKQKALESHDFSSIELDVATGSENQESRKFVFRTRDKRLLESVLIQQSDRRTVCVSTQLGCKIGCTFCASGKGAFGRNLTAGEIIEQVMQIEAFLKEKITNIVFMGMGEPLDNFDETMKALEIMQADWGFDMGSRRITVSTSGITPKILDFVNRNEGRVRLSVSLHSSLENKRSELVPINKKYSLKELVKTLEQVFHKLKRDITFEYTLISGENDSVEEAEGVARIAKPLRAKVNIIPYNPIREMDYKRPDEDVINRFLNILEKRGVKVIVRQTAGRDIDAACGQLRLDRESNASGE